MIDIKSLRVLLLDEVKTIRFTKVNGEDRVMKCTLNRVLIDTLSPAGKTINDVLQEGIDQEVASEADYIRVFDVEKKGWRTVKVESVYQVDVE